MLIIHHTNIKHKVTFAYFLSSQGNLVWSFTQVKSLWERMLIVHNYHHSTKLYIKSLLPSVVLRKVTIPMATN